MLATARVEHTVAADYLGAGIRKEWESVPPLAAEVPGLLGRIDADRGDLDAAGAKFREALLKTPQLGVAQRSPVAAIEDQQDGAIAGKEIPQRHRLAAGIR